MEALLSRDPFSPHKGACSEIFGKLISLKPAGTWSLFPPIYHPWWKIAPTLRMKFHTQSLLNLTQLLIWKSQEQAPLTTPGMKPYASEGSYQKLLIKIWVKRLEIYRNTFGLPTKISSKPICKIWVFSSFRKRTRYLPLLFCDSFTHRYCVLHLL